MYTLIFSPEAEEDVNAAFDWYEAQRKGLGDLFLFELRTSINFLATQPLLFQVRYDDVRINFLKKFPYGIHYTIHGNSILVWMVCHQHTNYEMKITKRK